MKDYSFGNFLRELRERRGLSQVQLGALVGVSNKAVSKWENGSSMPKSPILFRLSEFLGVTVDDLLACKYRSSESNRKGIFAMKKQKELWKNVYDALRERYGNTPPLAMVNRLESEKAEIEGTDFIVYLNLLAVLRKNAEERGHHVRLFDGCSGFYTAYLLGVTDLDPMPPHYFCPDCGTVEFVPDTTIWWDLPQKTCACGCDMQRDGCGLPFEAYRPHYQRINLSIWVDTGFYSAAETIIRDYFADTPLVTFDACGTHSPDEWITFIVLPPDKQEFARNNPVISFEENRFTFKEHPYVHLVKRNDMDSYRMLEQETNTSFDRIPYLETGILEAFAAADTEGIPEFWTKYIQEILLEYPPKSYSDLLRINSMLLVSRYSHTQTEGNTHHCTRGYIHDHIKNPSSPAFRDDIFLHVQSRMTAHGHTDTGFAYAVMRDAYRGIYGKNGMDDATRAHLLEIGVSPDYIDTLTDIRYIFFKYRAVLDVRDALILMWYKRHYPEIFEQTVRIHAPVK